MRYTRQSPIRCLSRVDSLLKPISTGSPSPSEKSTIRLWLEKVPSKRSPLNGGGKKWRFNFKPWYRIRKKKELTLRISPDLKTGGLEIPEHCVIQIQTLHLRV